MSAFSETNFSTKNNPQNFRIQNHSNSENIYFEMKDYCLFIVFEENEKITKECLLSPGQIVDSLFTYSENHGVFFVPLANSEKNTKKTLIGFAKYETGILSYSFLEFTLVGKETQLHYRGVLDFSTRDEKGNSIYHSGETILNIYHPKDHAISDFCDVLCLVENLEQRIYKIITLNKQQSNNTSAEFSIYPLQGLESIPQYLFQIHEPLFLSKQDVFLISDYGNALSFYSIEFSNNDNSFRAVLCSQLSHNSKLHENWSFQFPKLSDVDYFGNDIDTFYCPLQISDTNSNQQKTIALIKRTDSKFSAIEFVTLDDGTFEPKVLATSAPYPYENYQASGIVLLNSQETILMRHENGDFFFLGLEKNQKESNEEFLFQEFPMDFHFLIQENLNSEKISAAEKNHWKNLLDFLKGNISKDESEFWTFKIVPTTDNFSNQNQASTSSEIQLIYFNEESSEKSIATFPILKNGTLFQIELNNATSFTFQKSHTPEKQNSQKKSLNLKMINPDSNNEDTPDHDHPEGTQLPAMERTEAQGAAAMQRTYGREGAWAITSLPGANIPGPLRNSTSEREQKPVGYNDLSELVFWDEFFGVTFVPKYEKDNVEVMANQFSGWKPNFFHVTKSPSCDNPSQVLTVDAGDRKNLVFILEECAPIAYRQRAGSAPSMTNRAVKVQSDYPLWFWQRLLVKKSTNPKKQGGFIPDICHLILTFLSNPIFDAHNSCVLSLVNPRNRMPLQEHTQNFFFPILQNLFLLSDLLVEVLLLCNRGSYHHDDSWLPDTITSTLEDIAQTPFAVLNGELNLRTFFPEYSVELEHRTKQMLRAWINFTKVVPECFAMVRQCFTLEKVALEQNIEKDSLLYPVYFNVQDANHLKFFCHLETHFPEFLGFLVKRINQFGPFPE